MSMLVQQRCLNHLSREAVGRCVECTEFFCRECIAEHDGRLICANCLSKLATKAEKPRRRWPGVLASLISAMLGLLFAWICFYAIGRTLVTMPSSFHAQNIWNSLGALGDD